MKVLVIDNYDSFTYNLVSLLRETKASATPEITVKRNDRIDSSEITAFDKLVFSPGPGVPTQAGSLKEIIAAGCEASKPMLGICLGHQAIAEVLGGKLYRLDKVVHGKSSSISLKSGCALFEGLSDSITAARYHSWAVTKEELPSELSVTASSEDGTIMGLQHSHLPVYGLQFHPESILSPEGGTIIQNFIAA